MYNTIITRLTGYAHPIMCDFYTCNTFIFQTTADPQVDVVTTQPSLQSSHDNHKSYCNSSNTLPWNILGLSIFTCICCLCPVGLVALILSIVVSICVIYMHTWLNGDTNALPQGIFMTKVHCKKLAISTTVLVPSN